MLKIYFFIRLQELCYFFYIKHLSPKIYILNWMQNFQRLDLEMQNYLLESDKDFNILAF